MPRKNATPTRIPTVSQRLVRADQCANPIQEILNSEVVERRELDKMAAPDDDERTLLARGKDGAR
jgi:hypothetical protein